MAKFTSMSGGVQLASNSNNFLGGLEIHNNYPTKKQPVVPVLSTTPPVVTSPTTAEPALVFAAASQTGQSSSPSVLPQGTTPGIAVKLGPSSADTQLSWMVQVVVPKGTATSGTGFAFAVPEELQKDIGAYGLQATRMDGTSLPAWLQWDANTMRFISSAVPDGAFPMQVSVSIGTKRAVVLITERQQN